MLWISTSSHKGDTERPACSLSDIGSSFCLIGPPLFCRSLPWRLGHRYIRELGYGIGWGPPHIFLLGLYISHRERRLADYRRRIALRSLSLALRRHVGTLFSMFKATSSEAPDNSQRQVKPKGFFDEKFYNTIVYLDFSVKAPAIPEMSWGKYLALNFEDFTNRLERALDIFGVGLFPGDLDLLELLVNSPYARMFTMNSSIPLTGDSAMMLLSIEDGGSITFVSTKSKEYFDRSMRVYHEALMKLIDIVNESLRDTDQESIMVVQHWEEHVAPVVGSARGKIMQPT